MRLGHILFSAVHFLVVFFILCTGALLFLLPYAPSFRLSLSQALMDHPLVFQKAGFSFLFLGSILLIVLYFLNRKTYLQLKGKRYQVGIEQTVVRALALDYFHKMFENSSCEVDVVIRKGQFIEILTQLPQLQETMLERIESELSILFQKRLGYQKEILFNFQMT